MRRIPNIITIIRMIMAFSLIFIPLNYMFYTVYALAALSDVLDGFLARHNNWTSKSGAALDSASDTIFIFVCMYRFIPVMSFTKLLIILIIAIFIIKLLAVAIGMVKYHKYTAIHTILNKITGALLAVFVPLSIIIKNNVVIYVLIVVAAMAAIEELIIVLKDKELNRNKLSIFM